MNLHKAMTLAAHIATGKSALPILATVRIAGGHLYATDLDQEIDIAVDLPKGLAKADLCVHAARLLRILKALPEDAPLDITLAKSGKRITLAAAATRYELNTLPAADFPSMTPGMDEDSCIEIEAAPFVAALKFVAPAMASGDIRYYLNGAEITTGPAGITLCATEGHRLHRVQVPLPGSDATIRTGIIGNATVARVIELAATHEDIAIGLADNRFVLAAHTETLNIKTIEGKFPDVMRVIPTGRPVTAGVPREAFAAAIRRVTQIYAATKDTGAAITLDLQPEAIDLAASNTEGETAAERFEWNASAKAFRPVRLTFQSGYLLDALGAFTGERVMLHAPNTADDSLYITDDDAGTRQAVVMPYTFRTGRE